MMRCLYYLSPNLHMSEKVSEDLHAIGVDDWYLHVISKNESGLAQKHIHSSNYFETLDLLRGGTIGAGIGFLVAVFMIVVLAYFQPFGPNVPTIAYVLILLVITFFGMWEGGLFGIDKENKKLEKFHDDIEVGKYLVLIYAVSKKEDSIKHMMAERHPESELVAVDKHFINPFSRLNRLQKQVETSA